MNANKQSGARLLAAVLAAAVAVCAFAAVATEVSADDELTLYVDGSFTVDGTPAADVVGYTPDGTRDAPYLTVAAAVSVIGEDTGYTISIVGDTTDKSVDISEVALDIQIAGDTTWTVSSISVSSVRCTITGSGGSCIAYEADSIDKNVNVISASSSAAVVLDTVNVTVSGEVANGKDVKIAAVQINGNNANVTLKDFRTSYSGVTDAAAVEGSTAGTHETVDVYIRAAKSVDFRNSSDNTQLLLSSAKGVDVTLNSHGVPTAVAGSNTAENASTSTVVVAEAGCDLVLSDLSFSMADDVANGNKLTLTGYVTVTGGFVNDGTVTVGDGKTDTAVTVTGGFENRGTVTVTGCVAEQKDKDGEVTAEAVHSNLTVYDGASFVNHGCVYVYGDIVIVEDSFVNNGTVAIYALEYDLDEDGKPTGECHTTGLEYITGYGELLYVVWAEEFTSALLYDANGGTGAPEAESYTDTSTEAHVFRVSSDVPSRDGYEFLGWSTDPHADEADYHGGYGISVEKGSTTTLYAVWVQVHTSTLVYDANGGTGAPEAESVTDTTAEPRTFTVSETTPVREGFIFLGWSADPAATEAAFHHNSEVTVGCDETLTLYAVWTHERTYALVFDADGGEGAPEAMTASGASDDPHVFTVPDGEPVREGYKFLGWSESRGASVAAYAPGDPVHVPADSTVTLYAVWREVVPVGTFTLVFDANGGDGAPDRLTYEGDTRDDHVFTVPHEAPTRDGYDFAGWSTSRNASSAEYWPGDEVAVAYGATVTLYAVWAVSPSYAFTLSYDANGGSGAPADVEYTGTSRTHTFKVSSSEPTRSGYAFLGWSTSKDAVAAAYLPGDAVSVSGDVTLYAVWSRIVTTVLVYDANGGTGAPDPERVTDVEGAHDFTVSSVEPTRSGYAFLGWSTSMNDEEAEYWPGDVVTIGGGSTVTLYAVWTREYTTTLAFDANGGEGAPDAMSATDTVEGSHAFTLPETEPTWDGHVFLGWAESADASDAQYWPGEVVHVGYGSTMTLYALWSSEDEVPMWHGGSDDGSSGSARFAASLLLILLAVAVAAYLFRLSVKEGRQ